MSPNSLRILLVAQNPVNHGGTYWRALRLGAGLARRHHAVTLIVTSATARWRLKRHHLDGVEVIEAPDWLPRKHYGWDPWNTLRRMLWVGPRQFDLVHAFETRPVNLLPALVARARGAKLFFDWCDWLGRGGSVEEQRNPVLRAVRGAFETFFEDGFRGWAYGTTVLNSELHQRARALGVPARRLCLLRNGSPTTAALPTLPAARAQFGLPPDVPLIGHLGRPFRDDARLMAAAFNLVQRARPAARLLLIGQLNHPIEDWLDQPAAALRTGLVDDSLVHPYLAACDLCWVPLGDTLKNRGRLPIKINDYLAAGRPIVATRVGDVPAIVEGCAAGAISTPDAPSLAQTTLALLDDPARRAAMSLAALQAAAGNSWDHVAERAESFYRQLGVGG